MIGELVKKFESGTRGCLSFSNCGNDMGLSCGTYQLTLAYGNCITFLKKYYPKESSQLYYKKYMKTSTYPGIDYCSKPESVKEIWTKCYNINSDKFIQNEYDFIKKTYYDVICKRLSSKFNPDTHSRMAQECLWSWSIHRGVTGAYNEFMTACSNANIDPQKTDAKILIDILYDERYKSFPYNRYKKGINKIKSERETLREYCSNITQSQVIDSNGYIQMNGYVKFKTNLNVRKIPSWEDNAILYSKPIGTVLTIIGKLKVGTDYMYKTKMGYYVTANEKYVTYLKTI